jgi:hypothetical protein
LHNNNKLRLMPASSPRDEVANPPIKTSLKESRTALLTLMASNGTRISETLSVGSMQLSRESDWTLLITLAVDLRFV